MSSQGLNQLTQLVQSARITVEAWNVQDDEVCSLAQQTAAAAVSRLYGKLPRHLR